MSGQSALAVLQVCILLAEEFTSSNSMASVWDTHLTIYVISLKVFKNKSMLRVLL